MTVDFFGDVMIESALDEFRELLGALKAELTAAEALGVESEAPVELDQTRMGRLTRMDAMQAQAMSQETGRRRRAMLRAVERALGRIETGEFGECAECGEDIATARLRANPTVTLCIECAALRESE